MEDQGTRGVTAPTLRNVTVRDEEKSKFMLRHCPQDEVSLNCAPMSDSYQRHDSRAVNQLRNISFQNLEVRSIPAPSVSRFAALAGIGIDRLQERTALLVHLNTLVLEVAPLLEFGHSGKEKTLGQQCLQAFRLPNA